MAKTPKRIKLSDLVRNLAKFPPGPKGERNPDRRPVVGWGFQASQRRLRRRSKSRARARSR